MMTVIKVTDMACNFSVSLSFQTGYTSLSHFFLSHPFHEWPLTFALPASQKPSENRFSHTPVQRLQKGIHETCRFKSSNQSSELILSYTRGVETLTYMAGYFKIKMIFVQLTILKLKQFLL